MQRVVIASLWMLMPLALLGATHARAAPQTLVRIDDPRGDDHGPGSYQYPTSPRLYPAGALDLRSFEVLRDGDDVVFRVTMGAIVRRSALPPRRQLGSTEVALDNTITAQNIDIYIDTHGARGFTETVPGRNVLVRDEDAWDVAVVLTPQPAITRSLVRDWEPARQVIFPSNVQAEGATFVARVPLSVLLRRAAVWEYSFSVVDRTLGGRNINAFTMPVAPVPETLIIGGAPLSRFAPAVMDLLAPAQHPQHETLRVRDDATTFARVPLVYPHAVRPRAVPAPEGPDAGPSLDAILAPRFSAVVNEAGLELVVADVSGDLVILSRPPEVSLTAHRVGLVLGDSGAVEGRVVVTAVRESFVTATVIEGKGAVRKGSRVRFEAPPAPAGAPSTGAESDPRPR